MDLLYATVVSGTSGHSTGASPMKPCQPGRSPRSPRRASANACSVPVFGLMVIAGMRKQEKQRFLVSMGWAPGPPGSSASLTPPQRGGETRRERCGVGGVGERPRGGLGACGVSLCVCVFFLCFSYFSKVGFSKVSCLE